MHLLYSIHNNDLHCSATMQYSNTVQCSVGRIITSCQGGLAQPGRGSNVSLITDPRATASPLLLPLQKLVCANCLHWNWVFIFTFHISHFCLDFYLYRLSLIYNNTFSIGKQSFQMLILLNCQFQALLSGRDMFFKALFNRLGICAAFGRLIPSARRARIRSSFPSFHFRLKSSGPSTSLLDA